MPCFAKPPANGAAIQPSGRSTESVIGTVDASDSLMKLVLDDLIKRKAAKPRTAKTLKNTMQARCGGHASANQIEALFEALVARGYVRMDGPKVAYTLPAAG